MTKLRVGLIGFGLSGRYFHAPFLKAHPGFEIAKVSTSRAADVHAFLPDAQVVPDASAILNDPAIDLVINCAPNAQHFSLSARALEAGKHVVVEKPFVNTSEEGQRLIAIAKESNRVLSVFQNRRWDGDFLTVQKLIRENIFGEIKQFESHFDRWRPETRAERWREQAGTGHGILYDLGAHLIDQALVLFGEPDEIVADVAAQKGGATDDYFHLILKYKKTRVILHSSSFAPRTPRFQIFGGEKSFVKYGLDPQESQLQKGLAPTGAIFGFDAPENYGQVIDPVTNTATEIKTERGEYLKYYAQLYEFIAHGKGANPVEANVPLRVIQIIEHAIGKSVVKLAP